MSKDEKEKSIYSRSQTNHNDSKAGSYRRKREENKEVGKSPSGTVRSFSLSESDDEYKDGFKLKLLQIPKKI